MANSRERMQPPLLTNTNDQVIIKHGEDNPIFTNDDLDNVNVIFRAQTSSIDLNYRPNLTLETEIKNDDQQALDDEEDEIVASLSTTDDPNMPTLTFRAWSLGLLFTCLLSFVNQFFSYRTSPLFVEPLVVQLITFPLGKIMARILPTRRFRLFRWSFTLNPGQFTIKEHCIITAMANATCGIAYAIDVITSLHLFYKRPLHPLIGIFFVITSQTLGYGIAGYVRKFLVWPSAMVWPANFINCTLLRTLHQNTDDSQQSYWKMSRLNFFFIAATFQFLWYFFPGYICPVLSLFSWICMLKPDNLLVSQLTGINGLGLGSIELDWNAWVSFLGSPIVVPFWAQINIFFGFVLLAWFITPMAYYSNLWGTQTMPIVSNHVFTVDGYFYNVSAVLTKDLRLNETAYKNQGELRITAIFAFSYALSFATIASVIVHTILYNGKTIIKQFRSSLKDNHDHAHSRLMSQYREAPQWWYTTLFVVALVISLVVCHVGKLMPWYLLFLAVIIACLFVLPTGIVQAITNQTIGLNVITEFVAGLIVPGDPLANITFKTYGYITQYQALLLVSDLKLGHYMKIPPRAMFVTQLIGTIVAGIVNYITAIYLMGHIPNICTSKNTRWQCRNANTFFSGSVIWGVIGPLKMFGKGSAYSPLLYGFLIGALLPCVSWSLIRKYRKVKWLRRIHFPIMLSAATILPSGRPGDFPSWLLAGFFFNYILLKHARSWWKRYAYVFSAAMNCGVALSTLVIFFVFQNNQIEFRTWIGSGGSTGDGCPLSHANYSGMIPQYRTSFVDE